MNWHAIEPLDVLFLRGNKLFGDPGSYGEALVPPWPSAAAGAIRSAILVRDGVDLLRFAAGAESHRTLGTPQQPGAFAVTTFCLARRRNGCWALLFPQPADLVVARSEDGTIHVHRLQPRTVDHDIESSSPTTKLPVLAQRARSKPVSGWWLSEAGWCAWLRGEDLTPPENDKKESPHLVPSCHLWQMEERVGVGLEVTRRRAEDGKLFTTQAVAFCEGVGFLAATEGDALKKETLLRLGGDGRAARCMPLTGYQPPQADLEAIAHAGRARIVLTSPGLFPDGWRLPGMARDKDGHFELLGVKGRVVAAAVGRAEVVSGWDLAARKGRGQPKGARRSAPTGSVYWLKDLDATPEALDRLLTHGLWLEAGCDVQRRAEGFNRFEFAIY